MEVCRLCLELLPESNSVPLEGNMREMMLIVSPEMNLEISKSPVACIDCSGNLEELFVFKTKYFDNEESVRSKISAESKNKYNLSEILKGPVRNGSLAPEISKERTCRICLESIENESFTIMKPTEPDIYLSSMLTMCLPEIEIDLTLDPVMCEMCLSILQKLYHFKSTCVDIEEKLVNFCEMHGTNSNSQINLHNLLEINSMKTEIKTECELDYSTVKQEHFHDEENLEFEGSSTDMELSEDILKEEIDLKLDESEIKNMVEAQKKRKEIMAEIRKYRKTYETYGCSQCNFMSFKKKHLVEHMMKTHTTINDQTILFHSCFGCNFKAMLESELKEHMWNEHAKMDKYRCTKCSFTSTYAENLKRHMFGHEGIMDHTCPECNFKSPYKHSLQRHMKKQHSQKIKCKLCPYTCRFNYNLNLHMKSKHYNNKDLVCSLCDFKTVYPSSLYSHQTNIHKRCNHCIFVGKDDGELETHMDKVHGYIN